MAQQTRLWRTFKKNKTAIIGSIVFVLTVVIAISAPLIAPHDPFEQNLPNRLIPPRASNMFGTDLYGRDVVSRVIWGTRVSLLVGLLSVAIAVIVGTALGTFAAYKGGFIDMIIMRVVDILMSFPVLIMGLVVMAIVQRGGIIKLILAIGVIMAPRFARLVYGPTLVIKEKDFVEAARAVGVGDIHLLLRHILPNTIGEVLVMATLWIGTAIRIEANLSFIGLGVSPPTPTWGNMIRGGVDQLFNAPWLTVFPGLALLITVLAINMVGDGIRDITDPKLQI
jgi:peptide/nickel transport system permease protein